MAAETWNEIWDRWQSAERRFSELEKKIKQGGDDLLQQTIVGAQDVPSDTERTAGGDKR
jgi:hypothetical protein